MKWLLLILLVLFFYAFTGTNRFVSAAISKRDTVPTGAAPQLFGSKLYEFKNYLLVDSFIMVAEGDTFAIPRYPALKFKTSDLRWYGYHGTRWRAFLNGLDTISISNRINQKLTITDTANKWVNTIRRRSGTDTIEIFKNGSWQFAYKDTTGSRPTRTGVSPGAYPGADILVDTAGRTLYAYAQRNNLFSFNNVSDTLAFNRPAAHFNSNLQQALTVVSNPTLQAGSTNLTFAAWVKIDTLGLYPQVVLSKDDNATKKGSEYYMGYYPAYSGWVWQVEEPGHVNPNDGNTWYVISSTGVPVANQWYFIVGQYDMAGKVKIWVNGVKDSAVAVAGGTNITNTPFAIGAVVGEGDSTGTPECCSFMNGTIKSVGMWKRLLRDDEITYLYNNTAIQLPPPGLNPGTMIGGPTFSASVPSPLSAYTYSVNYDGTNDKTAMSNGISMPAGASSISLWFNADNLGGMVVGNSGNANTYIRVLNSTTIRVQTNITGTFKDYTVGTMSTGTWYNLIVTRGATNLTHVYLNGSESSSSGQSQTDPITLDEVGLYWDGSVPGLNWDGKVSDVRVYNSVLSGSDIAALQTNSATSATPFLWYKLNEGSGVINIDYGTAPSPHPLEYTELPPSFLFESPRTFISYWDLSEPYATRLDARLRNILRDSIVFNVPFDISRQNQNFYGSINASGNLNLNSTSSTTKGKTIIDTVLTVDGANKRVGINTTAPDFDFEIKNNSGNSGDFAFQNVSSVNTLRIGVDNSANTNITAYGSVNITSGNSNSISLIPATGVTVGPARATRYKLDVLENRTGLTDTTIGIYSAMSGSTYNTTSNAIISYGVFGLADGTRSSGSNALNNIGIYGRAENGQVNYAGYFDGKVVIKQADSVATATGGLLFKDAATGEVKTVTVGPIVASGTWTPTLTDGTNSSGASVGAGRYTRVGNIVTFSLTFTTTTSAGASATEVKATLPIASNFTTASQASGTNSGLRGSVNSDATNDILLIDWTSNTGSSETITITGQYIIL